MKNHSQHTMDSYKIYEEKKKQKSEDIKWGPRKELQWTIEELKRLQTAITKSCQDRDGNDTGLKFLVFGPTGHGKSSFCNGCRSAIKGTHKPSTYHSVANLQKSHTKNFHGALYDNHWIFDMSGIFESNKIDSLNIENIASGKVPFYAEITDSLAIKNGENLSTPEQVENDVACVIIVLRYDTELGPEIRRLINVILGLGGKGVLSFHLVLTCLDECDPQFKNTDNIPNLYKSPLVKSAVKRMSEETGIPPLAISFVKNYVGETETDINTSLLHLRVLETVLYSALDQVEKGLNEKLQKKLHSKQQPFSFSEIMFMLVVVIFAVVTLHNSWNSG